MAGYMIRTYSPPFMAGYIRKPSMTKRIITVGHSPDPDDAFMFYALAHGKLVTAVSIHAYAYLQDKYALLPSGCSMGDHYGPMVVARRPMTLDELKQGRIAVPGTMTTAFLVL